MDCKLVGVDVDCCLLVSGWRDWSKLVKMDDLEKWRIFDVEFRRGCVEYDEMDVVGD